MAIMVLVSIVVLVIQQAIEILDPTIMRFFILGDDEKIHMTHTSFFGQMDRVDLTLLVTKDIHG